MLVTLAGAMSTAELGLSLAEMIRQDKVHAICCTGANLEEDIFNLVAHDHYERVPNYRELSAEDELELLEQGLNRVTDTCIPEEEAMRRIERHDARALEGRRRARASATSRTSTSTSCSTSGVLEDVLPDRPQGLLAARRRREATCRSSCPAGRTRRSATSSSPASIARRRASYDCVKSRPRVHGRARRLVQGEHATATSIGFFQIGGGIAGDFPICVVPLIQQDLQAGRAASGATSARSPTAPRRTAPTAAPCPTRRSPGASSPSTRRASSSSRDATIVAPLIFA